MMARILAVDIVVAIIDYARCHHWNRVLICSQTRFWSNLPEIGENHSKTLPSGRLTLRCWKSKSCAIRVSGSAAIMVSGSVPSNDDDVVLSGSDLTDDCDAFLVSFFTVPSDTYKKTGNWGGAHRL